MSDAIEIQRLDTEILTIPIIGLTPLIMHNFSAKAKKQMLDAMQGKKKLKEIKDPEKEYDDAFYKFKDGRFGFPSMGFKRATVSACRHYGKSVSMVITMQSIFVRGELGVDDKMLVPINGIPHIREDVVTVGMGGHDLRYRPYFSDWSADLEVTYVSTTISRDSVLSLVEAGGLTVGVGDWRPEKKGDFGTYAIDQTKNVETTS